MLVYTTRDLGDLDNRGIFTLQSKSTCSGLLGEIYNRATRLDDDPMNYSIIDNVHYFKGVSVGCNNNTMYIYISGEACPIVMPISGELIDIEQYFNSIGEKVLLIYSRSPIGFNVDEVVIQQADNNNYKVKRLLGFRNSMNNIKHMSNISDYIVIQSNRDAIEITEREKTIVGKRSATLKTHGFIFSGTEIFGSEKVEKGWFSTTVHKHDQMYFDIHEKNEKAITLFVYGGYKNFFKYDISKVTFTVMNYEQVSFANSKFEVDRANITGAYMLHVYNSQANSSHRIKNVVKITYDGTRACITTYNSQSNTYSTYLLECAEKGDFSNIQIFSEFSTPKRFAPDKAIKLIFEDDEEAVIFIENKGYDRANYYLVKDNKIISEMFNQDCKKNVFLHLCLQSDVKLDEDISSIRRMVSSSQESSDDDELSALSGDADEESLSIDEDLEDTEEDEVDSSDEEDEDSDDIDSNNTPNADAVT